MRCGRIWLRMLPTNGCCRLSGSATAVLASYEQLSRIYLLFRKDITDIKCDKFAPCHYRHLSVCIISIPTNLAYPYEIRFLQYKRVYSKILQCLNTAMPVRVEAVSRNCWDIQSELSVGAPCRSLCVKRPKHSQLNWAILLCDLIPDGKTE